MLIPESSETEEKFEHGASWMVDSKLRGIEVSPRQTPRIFPSLGSNKDKRRSY